MRSRRRRNGSSTHHITYQHSKVAYVHQKRPRRGNRHGLFFLRNFEFVTSLHIELEVMALSAEILTLFVHMVAVRALQLILIVRRHMRILRLHVLCLRDELLGVMALSALFDIRRVEFSRIALTVTHLTIDAFGNMTVGAELLGGAHLAGHQKRSTEAEH